MSIASLIIPCLLLVHISQSVAVRSSQNVLTSVSTTTNSSEDLYMYNELREYPDILADALLVRAIVNVTAGVVSKDYSHPRTLLRGKKLTQDPEAIKIMGPFDSGTNFVFNLCLKNDIKTHDCAYGQICPHGFTLGWKHWPLQIEPLSMKRDIRFNLMIVRHPLSWLLSMRKTSYDVACQNWDNFSTCSFDFQREVDQGERFKHGPGEIVGADNKIHFKNLIELWNMYGRGYLDTDIPGIILRYEDFLAHPQIILNVIKKETGIATGKAYVPMMQPAKDNPGVRGFESAKEYNLNKQFMAQYDEHVLKYIKDNVDLEVMGKFGYSL